MLLNCSINNVNKGTIVNVEAILDVVDILKNGNMETKKKKAITTLFSFSVIDESKIG